MTRYLARRLAFAALLVVVVSSASLVLARLAPGDFVIVTLASNATPEMRAQERARLGLDRSLAAQYADWLAAAARLDFGRSWLYDRPVSDVIPERAANTALLAIVALVLATAIGIPLGIVSATSSSAGVRTAIRAASVVLLSMPSLLMSLLLIFLAARTGWLPVGGIGTPLHLVVPSLAIALPLAATLERLQSQAMSETIAAPFVVATFARGVPRSRVVWRDALKPALKPVVSIYGLMIGSLLSGSFAVEVITAWPGLGSLMLDALRARDVYLVAGCAGVGALFLAFGTLVSDIALAAVDPRAAETSEDAA